MNDFLLLWLSLSLSGSLVAISLIMLKPLLRRFSKTWQYYAWLLVVLRLLIPFSPDTSVVGNLFQQAKTQLTTQNISVTAVPEHGILETAQPPAVFHPENDRAQKTPMAAAVFASVKKHIWGMVWLGLAIILFARKIVGYGRFLSAVNQQNKAVEDEQICAAFHTVCRAMGIRKKVFICTNALVRAPMLVGVIRPTIVLPTKTMPISELMLVFRHELTHDRRKDFFYKWLVELAVCLHWFNPLVYWVRKQINLDCEFSCDESVVLSLESGDRQAYGETLLNSIVPSNGSRAKLVSLSLGENGKFIKERLHAMMQYHRSSKPVAFVAAILASLLLCGTVFAGAYTVPEAQNAAPSTSAAPIRVSNPGIEPGGKISLGAQYLAAGTSCEVLLNWLGEGTLTVLCTAPSGYEKSYSVQNGKAVTFLMSSGGEYTVAIVNQTENTVNNVNGSITFDGAAANQPSAAAPQSIVYENVGMRRYEGEDGFPYIHEIKTNHTAKTVIGCQQGMLAFDEHGNPLKVDWWSMDDEFVNDYFYIHSWDSTEIKPGATSNVEGGWTLDIMGKDASVAKIAYILYCDKEITFEDGTVWANPNFDDWRATYEGKKIDVGILETYYPYEQKIA